MNNPILSIIIPVYNAEKYLPRCIGSILSQAFTDFELMLIDDGSKDKSGEICDEYAAKDKRIRVFHKPNGGVSSARNLGLDKAIGEYITFVDADDYLEDSSLNKLLFEGNYDVIQIPRNNGSFMKKYPQDIICKDKRRFRKFIYQNFYFECWGRLYKKKTIGANRFFENVRIGEDLMFFLNVYKNIDSFYLCSSCGAYHYSYVESSAMHKNDVSEEQLFLARLVDSKYKKDNDILALIIMIEFFYDKNICNVKNLIYNYPLCQILTLPIPFKLKAKYMLGKISFNLNK